MSHTPPKSYLVGITLFFGMAFILAGWVVIRANGYQVLFDPLRFVKSGVIVLSVHPKAETSIRLNGVDQPKGVTNFTDLAPGRYTISITGDGYHAWERTIELKGGMAARFADVRLFYTDPIRSPVMSETEQQDLAAIIAKPERFQDGLQVVANEIWAEDQLVARLSQPVQQALWLPGKKHVLYLVANQLHVVELSGKNDHTLLAFPERATVAFAPLSGGQELVLSVDGQLEIVQITAPKALFQLHAGTPFQKDEDQIQSE